MPHVQYMLAVPAGHATQDAGDGALPTAFDVPAGHSVHAATPARLYCPTRQLVHDAVDSTLGLALCFPAAHGAQYAACGPVPR